MRQTSLVLIALVVMLTGCDWFTKGGGNKGGGGKQEGPGRPGPTPEPETEIWLEKEALPEIHREFSQAQRASTLTGRDWERIAGWKLYQAVDKKVRGLEGLLQNQLGARVFAALFENLTEADGSVVAEIDPAKVIRELKKEFKRKR